MSPTECPVVRCLMIYASEQLLKISMRLHVHARFNRVRACVRACSSSHDNSCITHRVLVLTWRTNKQTHTRAREFRAPSTVTFKPHVHRRAFSISFLCSMANSTKHSHKCTPNSVYAVFTYEYEYAKLLQPTIVHIMQPHTQNIHARL